MKFSVTVKRYNGDTDKIERHGPSSSEVYLNVASLRAVKAVIAVIEIKE